MGRIVSRRCKGGSIGYTAQIRIHQEGRCLYSESQTLDLRQLATKWTRRYEPSWTGTRPR
jgi:hypothetical protein